jgi:hypothetical protein
MTLEAKTIFRQLQDAGYGAYSPRRTVDYDPNRFCASVFNGQLAIERRVVGDRQRGFTAVNTDTGVLVRYSGRSEDEKAFLNGYARALENFGHAVQTVVDPERKQRVALLITEGE